MIADVLKIGAKANMRLISGFDLLKCHIYRGITVLIVLMSAENILSTFSLQVHRDFSVHCGTSVLNPFY